MVTLYGLDGCPAGWLGVQMRRGSHERPTACLWPTLQKLGSHLVDGDVVAIDMPTGLAQENLVDHGRRVCDAAAKSALGPRACCVFFTPARGILRHLASSAAASQWHKLHTGKGLSIQAFHLLPKIRELDAALQTSPALVRCVSEVHPELSFAHWQAEGPTPRPIFHGKKTEAGRRARRALIEDLWPGAIDAAITKLGPRSSLQEGKTRRIWALDDLHDAFAALWTAERIATGNAVSYPPAPALHKDALGLPMRIRA